MTIPTHKLGTFYGSTKFIQGSTSNYQLAIKIPEKNSEASIHEKSSNRSCLKEDEFT